MNGKISKLSSWLWFLLHSQYYIYLPCFCYAGLWMVLVGRVRRRWLAMLWLQFRTSDAYELCTFCFGCIGLTIERGMADAEDCGSWIFIYLNFDLLKTITALVEKLLFFFLFFVIRYSPRKLKQLIYFYANGWFKAWKLIHWCLFHGFKMK